MAKMTMDGVSTTNRLGQEQYEPFTWGYGRRKQKAIQYDYRHTDGELFSCCAPTLDACRAKRDAWLEKKNNK